MDTRLGCVWCLGALGTWLALVVGCAGAQRVEPSVLPPRAEAHLSRTEIVPAPYSSEPTAGLMLGDAVTGPLRRALSSACQEAGLTPDGRLAQVALQVAQTSGVAQEAPQAAAVSYYARRAGLTDPTPQLWLASASPVELVLEPLQRAVTNARKTEALTHCGGAAVQAGELTVVAVALSRRQVALEGSIPRTLELNGQLRLKGELARRHDKATLAVTPPRGDVQRVVLPRGRSFQHTLRFRERGEHMLELLAEGPSGVTVVAMFPVTVGEAEAKSPIFKAQQAEQSAEQVTEALVGLIANERKRRGLPALSVHATLARVAAAHSLDMRENHFIAHTSPSTGEAIDRVDRAGVDVSLLLENIGRGYSAAEIHAGLMESPGHRANILNPEVRLLGIGVVAEPEGSRQAFLATQLFAQLMEKPKAQKRR